ncbi:MAG: hypothetical protein H7A36_06150 [Chlamydiales bacterium]|nr:hypothetical protein [Chlamydiales bacterium]
MFQFSGVSQQTRPTLVDQALLLQVRQYSAFQWPEGVCILVRLTNYVALLIIFGTWPGIEVKPFSSEEEIHVHFDGKNLKVYQIVGGQIACATYDPAQFVKQTILMTKLVNQEKGPVRVHTSHRLCLVQVDQLTAAMEEMSMHSQIG